MYISLSQGVGLDFSRLHLFAVFLNFVFRWGIAEDELFGQR